MIEISDEMELHKSTTPYQMEINTSHKSICKSTNDLPALFIVGYF